MPDGFTSYRPIYLIADASLQALGNATLGGTLSGWSPLTIEGPGTLDLTGSSLFSGPALVKNGTLLVNGVLPAEIALGKGATLGGNGMIASFAAAAGSTVSPGDSIGTLHVVDSAAFGPGSTYEAQLGAPGTSDLIAIDGQAFLAGHLLALPAAGFEPGFAYGENVPVESRARVRNAVADDGYAFWEKFFGVGTIVFGEDDAYVHVLHERVGEGARADLCAGLQPFGEPGCVPMEDEAFEKRAAEEHYHPVGTRAEVFPGAGT